MSNKTMTDTDCLDVLAAAVLDAGPTTTQMQALAHVEARLRGEAQAEQQAVSGSAREALAAFNETLVPDLRVPDTLTYRVAMTAALSSTAAPVVMSNGIDLIKQLREAINDVPETIVAVCGDRAFCVRDNLRCIADLIATAAPAPVAGDLTLRARELLAVEFEREIPPFGKPQPDRAADVRRGVWDHAPAHRALVAALSSLAAPVAGDAVSRLPERWRSYKGSIYADNSAKQDALHDCADELEAALAQDRASQAGAGVPEGWRLVPVVPTAEMRAAFRADAPSPTQFTHTTVQIGDFDSRYQIMIAYAPTPAAEREVVNG